LQVWVLLNAMKGVPPWLVMGVSVPDGAISLVGRHVPEGEVLCCRVHRAGSCVESFTSRPWISMAVTTFVFTPHMTCAFTQSWRCRGGAILVLNHGVKRDVVKPADSTAKSIPKRLGVLLVG
jgi:hypothetical protein